MSGQPAGGPAPSGAGARLLALYDHALPQVYGYLLARCGQRAVAEDLTAETFLAAVDAVRAGPGAAGNREPPVGARASGTTMRI